MRTAPRTPAATGPSPTQDLPILRERQPYEVRRLFGVLFQDGAAESGMELPPLPPIALQRGTSDRRPRQGHISDLQASRAAAAFRTPGQNGRVVP